MSNIKHKFTSGKSDGGDATLVRPSNWNDDHDVLMGALLGDLAPSSAGAEDEEFEGTADTLPTDWSWVSAEAPTWYLNSRWKSIFQILSTDTTERKLRKANFNMAATSGLWAKMAYGSKNGEDGQFEFMIYDSASSNGYGFGIHNGGVAIARDSNAGVLTNRGSFTVGARWPGWLYLGVRRVSNTWETFFSQDGIHWSMIQSPDTRTFTVDRLELRYSKGTTNPEQVSVDWIRYRADNDFPHP